jgi:ribokinase
MPIPPFFSWRKAARRQPKTATHAGGGGINAAVALARLGLDTAAIAKLGRDARAETILARLMDEGVSTRYVLRDSRAPTGASVIISAHEHNAAVFTFRGANTLLEPHDLRTDAFAVDLVYVSNLSNKSADCFPQIVRCAKDHDALVAVNPGIRQLSARGGAFAECVPLIDILSVNRAEAEVLVPSLIARSGEGGPALPLAASEEPPELEVRGLTGGGFQMSLVGFLNAVRNLGVANVLLTDGAGGAFLKTVDRVLYCPDCCSPMSPARPAPATRSRRPSPPIWHSTDRPRKRCAPPPSTRPRWSAMSTPSPAC